LSVPGDFITTSIATRSEQRVNRYDSPDGGEAESWVRSSIPTAGPFELLQAEPWGTVFRVPIDGGAAWFKACAPHQAFEVPLTASLSARWNAVTDVLAHDVERRWLLMADAGEPLNGLGNPPQRWLEILPAYAELQLGEIGHAEEHLANGVPDLRLERLPTLFDELLRADLPLEPDERATLGAFGPRFAELCAQLADAGIGPSVQHDDLHMNNVYVKDLSLRVLDWGDASIAHPFFSLFETFRFLVELNGLPEGDPWFARLRDAYLEPWGGDRRATFELAQRVGGLAHAIAWLHQREALPIADRPEFDPSYAVILRLALRLARHASAT
jgi:phosphotransferase family enzyme